VHIPATIGIDPSVMESNDYRLERWLAIILSLLFFLPFVVRL
jgi:hypothetical protein